MTLAFLIHATCQDIGLRPRCSLPPHAGMEWNLDKVPAYKQNHCIRVHSCPVPTKAVQQPTATAPCAFTQRGWHLLTSPFPTSPIPPFLLAQNLSSKNKFYRHCNLRGESNPLTNILCNITISSHIPPPSLVTITLPVYIYCMQVSPCPLWLVLNPSVNAWKCWTFWKEKWGIQSVFCVCGMACY